jgi:hypothetical protein
MPNLLRDVPRRVNKEGTASKQRKKGCALVETVLGVHSPVFFLFSPEDTALFFSFSFSYFP